MQILLSQSIIPIQFRIQWGFVYMYILLILLWKFKQLTSEYDHSSIKSILLKFQKLV